MISKRFIWKTPFSGVGSSTEPGLDTDRVCYSKDTPGETVFSADSPGGPPAGKRLGWLPLFYGVTAEPSFLFPVYVLHEAASPVFHTWVAKPKGGHLPFEGPSEKGSLWSVPSDVTCQDVGGLALFGPLPFPG